jgi:hypothetical protein
MFFSGVEERMTLGTRRRTQAYSHGEYVHTLNPRPSGRMPTSMVQNSQHLEAIGNVMNVVVYREYQYCGFSSKTQI